MPPTAPYTTDVLGMRVLTKWDPGLPGSGLVQPAFVYEVPARWTSPGRSSSV